MSVTFPAAGALPPRIAVAPLRGYQAQARRLADLLTAAPGVAHSGPSALEAALAVAGRRPGDYSGKIDVRLTPGMPAGAAVAAVLTSLLDSLEANVTGTVRDIDTEFLHDLRIAVGDQVRAEAGRRALPGGLARQFRPEFRWLGDLTTPTRDLDVYLLDYAGMAAGLVAATASELGPFHDHLDRTRAEAPPARPRPAFGPVFPVRRHGGRRLRRPPARPRPTAARLAADRIAPRTGASSRARDHSAPRRRACMSCASAARSCGTCWRSSGPCMTRAALGG